MDLKEIFRLSPEFTDYSELRAQKNNRVNLGMINGSITSNVKNEISGISARVYHRGSWGFASDSDINLRTIKSVVQSADRNAHYLAKRNQGKDVLLASRPVKVDKDFSTRKKRLEQKFLIEYIRELDHLIKSSYPGLKARTLMLNCLDMEKALLTSDGSEAYTLIPRSLLYIILSTEKDGKPIELFQDYGGFGNFEENFSDPTDLREKINLQYEHLMHKKDGIYPDSGLKECILDADLAGILSHEAIGHTTEADIVLGGSVAADYLEKQVASPQVSMVDFAHHYHDELCPVPVFADDEGTQAEDVVIIDNGILKGFMHNKETANHFNAGLTGNARAFSYHDEPLIRMRNTAILPGNDNLAEMIASIDNGYYLIKSGNGQADSTSEFMFGITLGYEIIKGKLGRAILDTTISGVAFDMLKSVTMISNDMSWNCSGMCGKKQNIPVGMGGPAVKCKVNIGGK
ncbi:MAG: TldD/PmbA family protein [Candidatus Cloacimonetes bacterium]|nr:TldD/PmbA family protein [Candidatus Cloacimonadota bacterium]